MLRHNPVNRLSPVEIMLLSLQFLLTRGRQTHACHVDRSNKQSLSLRYYSSAHKVHVAEALKRREATIDETVKRGTSGISLSLHDTVS